MKRFPAPASLAAVGLAFAAGLAVSPRPAAGGPPTTGAQIAPQPDYAQLPNKVAALERSLAALQQQYAAHTHAYNPPRCNGFVNLKTLGESLKSPGQHTWGVCMVQPTGANVLGTTSGPKS